MIERGTRTDPSSARMYEGMRATRWITHVLGCSGSFCARSALGTDAHAGDSPPLRNTKGRRVLATLPAPKAQSDLSPVLYSKLVAETHGVPPEQLEMT